MVDVDGVVVDVVVEEDVDVDMTVVEVVETSGMPCLQQLSVALQTSSGMQPPRE